MNSEGTLFTGVLTQYPAIFQTTFICSVLLFRRFLLLSTKFHWTELTNVLFGSTSAGSHSGGCTYSFISLIADHKLSISSRSHHPWIYFSSLVYKAIFGQCTVLIWQSARSRRSRTGANTVLLSFKVRTISHQIWYYITYTIQFHTSSLYRIKGSISG